MQKTKLPLLRRTTTTYIDLYGSVRRAAEKLGIDYAYLHRMSTGQLNNPGDDVLEKLGLEKIPGLEIHRRLKK